MKNLLFCIFLFGSYITSAQTALNDFKYIIVPKKFEGFKKENQYLTSTLAKHLFAEKGFLAVYDDELPEDLNSNRCLGLRVELDNGSTMFTTKTVLRLKDCSSKEVFATQEGKSKLKEYKAAYGEAIKDAFNSFNKVSYRYSAKTEQSSPITVSFKDDVKKLDEKKAGQPKNAQDRAVLVQEATEEKQTYKSLEPIASNIKKSDSITTNKPMEGVLYAQAIPNGYQLVDSAPKIQMRLLTTSVQGIYLVERGDIQGILFNKDGHWIFEYYEGDGLRAEELAIKF